MTEQTTPDTPPTTLTDAVIPFWLDGVRYVIKPNEISANRVRECRQETGYAPAQLFGALAVRELDLDIVAALIWLARRQAGEPITIRRGRVSVRLRDEIESNLTYQMLNDSLELEDMVEEPNDPQP